MHPLKHNNCVYSLINFIIHKCGLCPAIFFRVFAFTVIYTLCNGAYVSDDVITLPVVTIHVVTEVMITPRSVYLYQLSLTYNSTTTIDRCEVTS